MRSDKKNNINKKNDTSPNFQIKLTYNIDNFF